MNQEDQRNARRVSRPIDVRFWSDGESHQGRIEDLSESGAFIWAGHHWPAETVLRLSFELPESLSHEPIETSATVVWVERLGFAVRFQRLSPAARDRIRFFVESELFSGSRAAAADLG